MFTRQTSSLLDLGASLSAAMVNGGILTMALFPFAIPMIVLIVVPVIALGFVVAVIGAVGAILVAPLLLLGRRLR